MSEHERKKQLVDTFYTQTEEDVLKKLETSAQGLSSAEAEKRLSAYGANELDQGKKKSLFSKFLDQFKDLMIIILIVAAVLSGFMGDSAEAIMIILVVLLMAIFGVVQEAKAEQAIDALKSMSTPNANVLRDGNAKVVKRDRKSTRLNSSH